MGEKIEDEFTDLPYSRQYKWQLRKKKQKRCTICGKARATHSVHFCQYHLDRANEKGKEKYHSNK